MTSEVNIKEVEARAYRASQQDGLTEIMVGICLAVIAGLFLTWLMLAAAILLEILLFGPIMRTIRKRVTWPRTGYIRLVPEKPKKLVSGIFLVVLILIAIMAIIFLIFGDVRDFSLWLKWLPAFMGILLAGMFLSQAHKSDSIRHYIFFVISIITGFVLSILRFESQETGLVIYLLGMGGLLILCGLAMFIQFLRRYPIPATGESNANY